MLYNLLPIFANKLCHFCRREWETLDHIIFECSYIEKIRRQIRTWLRREGCSQFNRNEIIEMEGIKPGKQHFILSIYKYAIWTYRNIAIYCRAAKMDTLSIYMYSLLSLLFMYTYYTSRDGLPLRAPITNSSVGFL